MDNFFDVLNAALDEAIADAKNPYLERDVVTKEEQPRAKQIDKKSIRKRRLARWVHRQGGRRNFRRRPPV